MAQGNSSSNKSSRPRSRAARKNSRAGFSLTPTQQEQLIAGTLILIAVLTGLGALNLSGGNLLEGWTRILSVLFGWGRFLAPFFFLGFGVWLLLDSMDMRPDIGWERPLGLLILFLVVEAFFQIIAVDALAFAKTSLEAAQIGLGGGLVGHALYQVFVGALGLAGAVLILAVCFTIGLILLFNISVPQLLQKFSDAWHQFTSAISSRGAKIQSTRKSKERIPTEMVTAPPKKTNDEGRMKNAPRLPADFGADELIAEQAPARSPVSARIVGGGSTAVPVMVHREWRLPRVPDILEESVEQDASPQEIRERVKKIEETLLHFGVPAKVIEVNQGPTITQFGVEPGFSQQKSADGTMRPVKVKVNRISALQHDLELALAAAPIRVEAPVPGKPIVGIEVPNSQISRVSLRGVMEAEEFQRVRAKSALAFALGQDVSGQPIVADLGKMPHLLVAGATGSGKSVAVNAMITCMIMTNTPDDLKFVMVDPKRVELSTFAGIPHLLAPVVVEMDMAVAALNRTVQEMDDRYRKFSAAGARNIEGYNALPPEKRRGEKLPYLILVVDELADLMMTSPDEVEHTITRLAQMARATGIHLVLATQRPSVDVVTGLIKANFPSRISFAVTSQVDSRVVLDTPGAEKLLGRGDMLYMASDSSKLQRLQGCFVSDRELEKLVAYWKGFVESYGSADLTSGVTTNRIVDDSHERRTTNAPPMRVSPSAINNPSAGLTQGALWSLNAEPKKSEEDELLDQAIQIVQDNDRASVSLLQRKLRIGYSRAARLMELLEQKGYVGEDEGPTKGRSVLTPPPQPPPIQKPPSPKPNVATPSGGIIKPNAPTQNTASNSKSSPPPTTSATNSPAPKSSNTNAKNERKFQENDLDDFDDWTDEDWADLDK